jgi:hypothetical protein
MFTPRTIDEFGWFDHNFKPAYFEDNDYYTRIVQGGGNCRLIHHAKYKSEGSQTIKLEPEAAHHVRHWFEINRKRYAEKWGIPNPPSNAEDVKKDCFRYPWMSRFRRGRRVRIEMCVGGEYTDEEKDFLSAIDRYKAETRKVVLTPREVLQIARSLGYEKVEVSDAGAS